MADLSNGRPAPEDDGLTSRQRRFVVEFLKDRNGTQAAIRAGFAHKSAAVAASRLLRHAKVKAFLAARLAKIERETMEVSAERTLLELARLAYVDPVEFYDERGYLKNVHSMPEDARRALAGLESFEEFEGSGEDRAATGDVRKVKWHDKRAALDTLAKIQGLLKDKVEHTGANGGPLTVVIRDLSAEPKEET